ncbi:MAG: CRISPR-associated protein Csx11, partial [Dehalococcoidia bacterium]|nr:CRISPR-associated protein Csx11 [Dehalococcoidia bacterium]
MAQFDSPDRLRAYRPLLLAMEAVGWLHMIGKARKEFLQSKDSDDNKGFDQWFEGIFETWNQVLGSVRSKFKLNEHAWPEDLKDFVKRHKDQDKGLLGLLQAGHAMASAIEKNIPRSSDQYLDQRELGAVWLSTAFGYPVCNLLADPSELLSEVGWTKLVDKVKKLLIDMSDLLVSGGGVNEWQLWRNEIIGQEGWLRRCFSTTVADTRVPNNDVTLFDQSYVASALFKSAVAGAVLEDEAFPWSSKDLNLKRDTRWRLLTIGIGSGNYEARAVKIGDWTGTLMAIKGFFDEVCRLVEVDLAIGSLLY